VEFRAERLHEILSAFGSPERLDAAASRALWIEVRDVHCLADGNERLVWRISVPPMQGPRLLASLRDTCHARGFCDWAGGLVWLDVPPSADASAAAIRECHPAGRRPRHADPGAGTLARLHRRLPAPAPGHGRADPAGQARLRSARPP
jgi:glycolate oxidase FAD binding subunit